GVFHGHFQRYGLHRASALLVVILNLTPRAGPDCQGGEHHGSTPGEPSAERRPSKENLRRLLPPRRSILQRHLADSRSVIGALGSVLLRLILTGEGGVGTFGTGPFGSDGALDLLDELKGQAAGQRRETVERIFSQVRDHPDVLGREFFPDEVVAAAAVVAAGLAGGEAIRRALDDQGGD